MATKDPYLANLSSSQKDPFLVSLSETTRPAANQQTVQNPDTGASYDLGNIFRMLDINEAGPSAENSERQMAFENYLKGTVLEHASEGKVFDARKRNEDALLISAYTGRDQKDVLDNYDQYVKFFTGNNPGKGVLGAFRDYFDGYYMQKQISNAELALLDIPYDDPRREYYENNLETMRTNHQLKTSDVSNNSEFWRKVASSGNIFAQTAEQLNRTLLASAVFGAIGGAVAPQLGVGMDNLVKAQSIKDAMKLGQSANMLTYTICEMGKAEAAEVASEASRMVDENGNRIPLEVIKEIAYPIGVISALTEIMDDALTPLGQFRLGKRTIGETVDYIKNLLGSNPLGYIGLGVAGTTFQALQEGLQSRIRRLGIDLIVAKSNNQGNTSLPVGNTPEDSLAKWGEALTEFRDSFIPMGVSQLLTGGLSIGATYTTAALSKAMQISPKMRQDASKYFTENGKVYDIGYIDTVGQSPVNIYEPKADKDGKTAEQKRTAPILMYVNKYTGALVPVYTRDRQYVEYLRENGVTGIKGVVTSEEALTSAGDNASASNLASILAMRIGTDSPVMGYDGSTIIMDSQEGVEAAIEDIESYKDSLSQNVEFEKQEDGSYRIVWENTRGTSQTITVRAKTESDQMVSQNTETEEATGNVRPVRTMNGEAMNGLFNSTIRKSKDQTLNDAELEMSAKYFYQQLTGLKADEIENLWENDYQAIAEKLPEGVDENTIEQGARFMPLLSSITGRSTEDLLNDPQNRIVLKYLGKAKKARYASGEEGYIAGALNQYKEEDGTNVFEIGLSDIASQTGTELVHELMHVARALAPVERLSGFVGLRGYTGKYGGMWRSDIRQTADGRYRLGARLYDTYEEAAALVEGNEEQFVRDFFEYLRTGEAPNAEVASFFGRLKQFLQSFAREFSKDFSDDTRRAFDMLLNGEVDIQPGQTIEEAVEDSERTLTDDVEDDFAQAATDYVDDENMYDEEGNPLYSLTNDTQWQTMDANTQRRIDADYEFTRNQYFGTDKWMKAPNGQPTKLTERQWVMVRTPAFKAWFGDWENDPENSSRVVDENGEPKVVYHGTNMSGFETFQSGDFGVFFTDDVDVAKTYVYTDRENPNPDRSIVRFDMSSEDEDNRLLSGSVYAVFLNMRDPVTYDAKGNPWYDIMGKGVEGVSPDMNDNEESVAAYAAEYSYDENPDNDGTIVQNVRDYGSGDDATVVKPSTVYVIPWGAENQIKSVDNVGTFSGESENVLYSLTPAQETRALQELDSFPEDERNRIADNFKRLAGTPWHREAMKALVLRNEIETLMEGRELPADSILAQPEYAKPFRKQIKALKGGLDGIFSYLEKASFIANPQKCVYAINSSLLNCNPSLECAKFCYASEGNYVYWQGILKSEIVTKAVESDPERAAKVIARQYKATPDYMDGATLRVFDKGDFSEQYVTLVKELNKNDIAVQVFSKRPEFLKQIDNGINVAMLSIDKSNRFLANENPDLAIAMVYTGRVDINFIEANAKRYEDHGGVILPVKLGTRILSQEELKALPQWARTKYTCPIDAGTKKLGEWNCKKCDINGTGGCFYKNTAASRKYKIYASLQDMDVEAIDEGTRKIAKVLEELGISPDSGEFRRILENLSRIKSETLAGIDLETERTGLQGNGEDSTGGDRAGELAVEENNRIVDEFKKEFPDADIAELDGVKYIKHSNDTYTDDELRSIKDSVSQTLYSLQPEFNFGQQPELNFSDNQKTGEQSGAVERGLDNGEGTGVYDRGLRPGIARYFDWDRGWNGQEPSTAINDQWDNLGYISFIGTRIEWPQDVAKLFSVYRNPVLEYFHVVFMKSDKIVGHVALSSGMPGRTIGLPYGDMERVRELKDSLGADGYYLIHNHPSGDVHASDDDINLTARYANMLEGFSGHIIMDHDTYTLLNKVEPLADGKARVQIMNYLPISGVHKVQPRILMSESLNNPDKLAKHMSSKNDHLVYVLYADTNYRQLAIDGFDEIPDSKRVNERVKELKTQHAFIFTRDYETYASIANNQTGLIFAKESGDLSVEPYSVVDIIAEEVDEDKPENTFVWSYLGSGGKNYNYWTEEMERRRGKPETYIPEWNKKDDAGTLYSLSPGRQSEILQARKAEIRRAVEAGIFVSTEYLEEFRGEDWVESELDFRDWMKENADIVTMAREADSFEQFKTRYEKKDESEEDADIPFSAEGLFDTEEEQEKYEDWLRKIYHYANALSLQDRDRRFAEEWTSSEDKTLELAKYLRSYMDAAWNPKPKSRSGGYWYTKNVYNSFKGVSQKVRMLYDGNGGSIRNAMKKRASSEQIKEAQELIRQNPRPYRNAYMQAMLGESRASDVQMGLRNIGESADWMKLDMIDDDIAQEIEKIEGEETAKKASGVDYKTDSQTLVQKRNDAETDLKKSGESTSSTAKDLKDKLASAEQRIRELEADIKNAESEVDEIIGRMGERIEDLEEKAGKNAALKLQLADRRARVKKLRRELSAANKEKTRLNNALNALRRWKEAKEEMDYRKKRIRQIRRLATFNDATLDAMFEDTFDWVAALFDRDEADMDRRKDLDQRISDLKHEIERAETGGEDASQMREALRRLQNQKKQSRILEPPAQLQRYLPRNYSVRADNRPSMWTSQELDTLLRAVQLMRMDAKAILQDKKNQRMATLMGTAYSYFQQSLGYEAPYNDYGEMSARALGEEVANLPDKTFGTAKEKYLSYHLYKLKIQRLARIIDGYKEGVAYNWFVRRNWKCQTEELKGTNERLDLGEAKWKELELRRGDLSKEGFKGTKLNGTEYSLTRGQMIGVYVYAQSDLGYEKLTSVYGNAIRKEDVEAITSQLSDKEKAWADFMLEEMQNNYPRLSKVYYNVWNRNLGQRPAYFPLVSSEARTVDQKDADFLCAQVNGKDGKAYVDKGFTKDVNPNAIYPLKLDVTATWNQQVRRQEHFIAYGEWSRDTQYLMDRGQMGDTIAKAYGPQYRKTLQKMVDHVISNTITTGTDFDRTITKYFSARNAAALTASVSTALKQLGSIGAIFENEGDIGKLLANENYLRNFLKANAELNAEYGDVKNVREFIYVNAPDIRNRQIDFEVMAYLNRVYGGAVSNTIQQATGKIMKYTTNLMDRLVVERLWLARYYTEFEAQKEAGKTVRQAHEEAVFKASQLISETQPTSMRMDQSAQQIEAQKSSLLRMVSVFTNQAMNLSNMIMADWNYARKNRDWKKVVRVTSAVLINAISVALISGRFIKKGDEDDEKYRWRLAREILGTVAQLADPVWGGNLLQGLTSAFGGSNYLNEFTDLGSVIRVLTTPTDRKTAWEKIADALEDIAGEVLNVMGIPGSNLFRKPVKAIQEKNAGYLLNSAWGQIIESYR